MTRSWKRCAARSSLLKTEKYTHSYMHCWRHKTPIIYRATSQWFAGMDVKPNDTSRTLRETALEGIENTAFFPAWGKQRLYSMIANRPDWTLSRQRQWGVPMAFFVHKETGELHPRTLELLEEVAQARGSERHRSVANARSGGTARRRSQHVREEPRHARRVVRFRHDALARAARLAQGFAAVSGGLVSGRLGPASRLVPFVAADRLHARRPPAVQRAAHARLHRRRRRPQDVEVARQRHRSA